MLVFGKHGMEIGNSGRTKDRHKKSLEAPLVTTVPKAVE